MDSAIHLLNNWGLELFFYSLRKEKFTDSKVVISAIKSCVTEVWRYFLSAGMERGIVFSNPD